MKNFSDLALAYGFVPTTFVEDPAWIASAVSQGKIIGEFKGTHLCLYSQGTKDSSRLKRLAGEGLALSPRMEMTSIDTPWKALEYFGEGEMDTLVCAGLRLDFPPKGREIIRLMREWVDEQKTALKTNEKGLAFPDFSQDVKGNAFLTNQWGKLLAFGGKVSEAGSCFREAAQMNVAYAEPVSNLGALMWQVGKHQEAFLLFTEAMLRNPHGIASQLNFFDASYELKEYGTLIKILEKSISEVPECCEFRHHLAIAYERTGRRTEAMSLLRDILTENPDDTEARELLDGFESGQDPEQTQRL